MSESKSKIAVVTGVSEGLGRSISYELLKSGFKVIGISSNKNKILKVEKNFIKFKDKFKCHCADVRNYNDLKVIAEQIQAPDLLVLNAGIYKPIETDKANIEIYKLHIDVNFLGVLNSYFAFLKKMILQKKGTILIMSSIAGWIGLPKAGAYGPTKSALKSFAQSARYDLEKYNIKVKVCSPGFVKTKATEINSFYMPGLMEPEEAAKIILKNINSSKFEISFPLIFSCLMKLLSIIPDRWSYLLIKKIVM